MARLAPNPDLDPGGSASFDLFAAAIDAILADLDAPIAQIDESFVAVGDLLTHCAALLGQVTQTFEALPKDLECAEIVEATQRLGDVIRHAKEIARSFDDEQVDLDALVAKVDAAHTPMASLRRVIQMIGIAAINARVVAAGIVGEADELDVFTTDIAELSGNAAGTIQRFFRAYETLSTDLHKAAEQRARFQAVQQSALEMVAGRLSGNLDLITQQRQRSAESSAETAKVTRDIGARVGSTVMAMQVGDATRQRIEHVVAALKDVDIMISGGAPEGVGLPETLRMTAIAALLEVQGELLAAARADYDKDVVEAEKSLLALAADEGLIMSQSRDLYGQKQHRGESALGELSVDMRQVAVMLAACDADRQRLDVAAMAVGNMVDQLLSHVEAVQQIEGSMRLVTLNAAVKCAQLGPRGKALDVIAKQLRELTGDTVSSAKAALSVLNQAAERARNVTRNAGGEASERITKLVEDANAAMALFEQVDRRLSLALRQLDEQGRGAVDELGEAVHRFSRHAAISKSLADAHVKIARLLVEIGTPDIEALLAEEPGRDLLRRRRKKCTMESERRIYDRLTGTELSSAPAKNAESGAAEDDLGLF